MQEDNDVVKTNRRVLHRLQESFRLSFDEQKTELNVTVNNVRTDIELLQDDN